jgi:HTH-type transcriptional regulator/antitoxin HipB
MVDIIISNRRVILGIFVIMISIISPKEVQTELAFQLKSLRKLKGHSRSEAAHRSGVPSATLRRFEDTGEISLRQFLMLCAVYGSLESAGSLFPEPTAKTMDEFVSQSRRPS